MYFDTHTHIYLNKKSTENEIIENLKKDNIEKIMSVGVDIETSLHCIELAKNNTGIIYAAVGIHPCDTLKYKDDFNLYIHKLERIIIENIKNIKAIGECGLDYFHINKDNVEEEKKIQKDFFIHQIKLSKKYMLPLIIHSRDAKEDLFELLKEYNVENFVLHCYSEDLEFAYKIVYYFPTAKISFSGIVTYPNALEVQRTAANISPDRILVETDCPYLAPQTVRGEENIPNNVKDIFEKIYELRLKNEKKETKQELMEKIYKNSIDFFRI